MVRKRGRPIGYKLSDATKISISFSKRGQRHTQQTRDKISRSLLLYFKKQRSLADEMISTYCRNNDESISSWFNQMSGYIDDTEDVLTYRGICNINKHELTCGSDIELASHNITPELLVMFKELCDSHNIGIDEFYDSL